MTPPPSWPAMTTGGAAWLIGQNENCWRRDDRLPPRARQDHISAMAPSASIEVYSTSKLRSSHRPPILNRTLLSQSLLPAGGVGLRVPSARVAVPSAGSKQEFHADKQQMHAEHADAACRYSRLPQPRRTALASCRSSRSVHLRVLRASAAYLREILACFPAGVRPGGRTDPTAVANRCTGTRLSAEAVAGCTTRARGSAISGLALGQPSS